MGAVLRIQNSRFKILVIFFVDNDFKVLCFQHQGQNSHAGCLQGCLIHLMFEVFNKIAYNEEFKMQKQLLEITFYRCIYINIILRLQLPHKPGCWITGDKMDVFYKISDPRKMRSRCPASPFGLGSWTPKIKRDIMKADSMETFHHFYLSKCDLHWECPTPGH